MSDIGPSWSSCFIKAPVLGTHLNCIHKAMQFKWVPTTYALKAYVVGTHLNCINYENKKYTGCNLKTTGKAPVLGTYLNCIDKAMQFKWIPTTYALKAHVVGTHLNCINYEDKKYTGSNLKTTGWLDCVLIRVCVVIRLNTVCNKTTTSKAYIIFFLTR